MAQVHSGADTMCISLCSVAVRTQKPKQPKKEDSWGFTVSEVRVHAVGAEVPDTR